jgi:hypothetical protein
VFSLDGFRWQHVSRSLDGARGKRKSASKQGALQALRDVLIPPICRGTQQIAHDRKSERPWFHSRSVWNAPCLLALSPLSGELKVGATSNAVSRFNRDRLDFYRSFDLCVQRPA